MANSVTAQEFMNKRRIKECWACDGLLFESKRNAEIRGRMKGKEVTHFSINAGARKKPAKPAKPETPNP